MSLGISTDVFCDAIDPATGKPCGNWTHGCTGYRTPARRARGTAALFGWTRRRVGGRVIDVCDICSGAPSSNGVAT